MSLYIMNSFSIPRAFRKSRQSQPPNTVPHLTIDVKGSKIQHILGISAKELHTARSQSLSSSSTARPPDSSLSVATTASVSSPRPLDRKPSQHSTRDLNSKPSSVLLHNDFEYESTKSPPPNSQLNKFPSSSTLNSHYDRTKAPLSISQQTSDSSSRDFALRKGAPPVIPRTSQEMEHAVQMLFIKSGKRRSKEGRKLSKINTRYAQETTSSPLSGVYGSRKPQGEGQIVSPSSQSLPLSPPPMTPGRKLFSSLRRAESQQVRPPHSDKFLVHDPYAKINVRRPKAGAKNWFDDVGDDLSEEESNHEPTANPNFVNQVERAFADRTPSNTNKSISAISSVGSTNVDIPTPKSAIPPRVSIPPGSARALLSEHKPLSRKVSFQEKRHQNDEQSGRLRKQPSTLAAADLSKQSVLCLSSSSDDEDGEENTAAATPGLTKSTRTKTQIRESLSEAVIDETDVEIGLAKTVKANSGEPIVRATHPRTEALRSPHGIPSLASIPTRASSRHASYLLDASTENDMSESDIITSFPATPSDTASFRTSIRSSVFSDNGSLASTRPMLVTKQEEKLLAAMRMKKAAMRRAERETDRSGALRVLESGGRNSSMSTRRAHDRVSEQAKLDRRLSNKYVPSHSHAHQRSLSDDTRAFPSSYARESGTSFETSVYSQRNSQATVRTVFSDDSDSPYSAYPRSDATVMSPTRPHPPQSATRGRPTNQRDTYQSLTSTGSSNRRDSHVVMLDGLDEALSREHVPSQLFMEAPFIGWERAGLTSAH